MTDDWVPPMGVYETRIAFNLASEIEQFAKSRGLGQAITEMLFRIRSEPNLQRHPDAAFVSSDRWPRGRRIPRGNAWDVIPDLVIEVVSPTNLAEEIPTKVREYFEAERPTGLGRLLSRVAGLTSTTRRDRSGCWGWETRSKGARSSPGSGSRWSDLFGGPEDACRGQRRRHVSRRPGGSVRPALGL